jgi:Xaa-Pro aminopeptidase
MTRLPMTATSLQSAPRPHALDAAELEQLLSAVEHDLNALGHSLRQHDSDQIAQHASSLRDALTRAIDGFSRASRAGLVPAALRTRLVKASRQVAEQRESLLRATIALDSAMEVLLPREDAVVYGGPGQQRGPALFRH